MNKIINSKYMLIIPLFIIMIISLLNMQNARSLSTLYEHNLIKQIIFFGIGIILVIIISKININTILKYSKYYYYISVLLLVLVLFFGKNINGSTAWFDFKLFSFQPSELVKLTLALYLSNIALVNKPDFKLILKVIIITLIPSILVFLEPDTGAIIFYFLIAITILLVAGVKKYWFVIFGIIIILLLGTFILLYIYNQDLLINLIGTSFFYRVERLITFSTESSYQLENAIIAMGSATIFGSGLNKVSLYIPEAPTDFIVAFSIYHLGIISFIFISLSFIVLDCYFIIMIHKLKIKRDKLPLFLNN